MINEDYCSYEVAKLLKEKGFDEHCDNYYDQSSDEPQQLTLDEMYYFIEQASDGNYSVYMDANDMDYLVTGTGKTEEEAIQCFNNGYEDIKNYYAEEGKEFVEVEFEYVRDKS